jgi:site-specific DNA-methyltransferase (adenine-specific)
MEFMKDYEDKHFDLAIVDPPYGIQKGKVTGFKKKTIQNEQYEKCLEWDHIPDRKYFKELFRVSKNQIIFGMQYFANHLPAFSQLIIWDKKTGANIFADGEAAFCSIPGTLRIFRHQWCGAFKDSEHGVKSTHVNQKPVALYRWLLERYAKKGNLILDTHLGSGSSRIAAFDLGFDFYGTELDKEYFEMEEDRFLSTCKKEPWNKYSKKTSLFEGL